MKRLIAGLVAIVAGLGLSLPEGVGQAAPAAPAGTPIWVAVDTIAPPFDFQRDEQVVGFDQDLIHAIARAEHLDIRIKVMPWVGIIPSLQAGSVDMSVTAITIKQDRLAQVNFSNAYYKSGLSVLIKKGSGITGYGDLAGRIVGVKQASSGADYVTGHDIGFRGVRQFKTAATTYEELVTGGVDAVINDNPINLTFAAEQNAKGKQQVQTVGPLLSGEYYGVAISKHRPDLVAKVNAGLAAIKASGEYQKLFDTWFGGDLSGAVMKVVRPHDVEVTNY